MTTREGIAKCLSMLATREDRRRTWFSVSPDAWVELFPANPPDKFVLVYLEQDATVIEKHADQTEPFVEHYEGPSSMFWL